MAELFAIPAVGGIIEKISNGERYILIQERSKEDALVEQGLIEIPAGKIRQYENIFDCLRREIKEETGLDVMEIDGERESEVIEMNGYKVVNYSPFNCAQNIEGYYPIMVQVFICRVTGELMNRSDESMNIRWISISDLEKKLVDNQEKFYPMHTVTLKKYIKSKE
jgi:ADP-ribose pyrophosphatase